MAAAVRQPRPKRTTGRRYAPAVFLLLLAAGCTSTTPRPPTEAPQKKEEAPFFGWFSRTDPRAVRLDVRALPCSDAVRGHCVLIATVVDEQGKPLTGKRVEWTLEGVGHILAADDRSGLLAKRGKVEKQYAVTDTGRSAQRVARNTGRPEDDIVLDTGETWCMITSAVEGETHLTVFAPDVGNPETNRAIVTHRWVDSAYKVPPPQAGRPGDRVPLATRVYRQSDNQPLPGYWVRYRHLDGPPVLLLPTGSTEALVISDATGMASAAAYQPSPQGGRTRLAVEILRPDPRSATAPPVVVGRGETAIDWQAPQIALTHTGPITVPVGKDATFTIAVRNNAPSATPAYTVRAALPDGAELVRSDPQAIRQGNMLIWTLGELPGGATRELHVVVRSGRIGALTSRATVLTAEGLRAEQSVTSEVVPPAAPKLEATLTAPPAALLTQGVNGVAPLPVTCQAVLKNTGTGPATNVNLLAVFRRDLLEHESKKDTVVIPVGTLRPGETRTVPLVLTPRQAGYTPIKVTVRADDGLTATAEVPNLKVVEAGLVVKLTGPESRYVGRPVEWNLEVKNTGQLPLQQVVVRDLLPPELQFVDAPEGKPNGADVVWDVGVLRPAEARTLKLTTKGARPATKVLNTAYASAQALTETLKPGESTGLPLGVLQAKAEASVAIRGIAALNLKLTDKVDPVHVGERTGYTIQVTNHGSLDAEHVQVVCKVPPEMRVVAVWGPGAYRLAGDRLELQPVDRVPPGTALSYAVDVEAIKPGDARFRAELTSATLKQPVVKEESTIAR
jgi:uncharacterized repeat protein (TIGR01451 family)